MKQLANKFSTIHFDGPLYFHFSSSLWVYHKGAGHLLKLFVGVSEKDVTVNNKGGATCSNAKQVLLASEALVPILNARV